MKLGIEKMQLELEFYVEDLEEHNTYLHEEVHRLSNLLDPNHEPQADAMDPGVILADDSKSEEEEEEDLEELVMIDESDNEGGNISGMDTEPEVGGDRGEEQSCIIVSSS